MIASIFVQDLTDKELELKIYETQETHDFYTREKLLKERKRRSLEK